MERAREGAGGEDAEAGARIEIALERLTPGQADHLLRELIGEHGADCWLVNTGWLGGPPGVGNRMKLSYTRAVLNAAIEGRLADVEFVTEPFFGLSIPTSVPDVPKEVLDPRAAWADAAAYDRQAKKLAGLFFDNFTRFAEAASPEILAVQIKP